MQENKRTVSFAMFAYWIAVIVWQTVRPVGNRSLVDTAVKIILFATVCYFGWVNQNTENSSNIKVGVIFFIATQAITLVNDTVNTSTLITLVFMVAQIYVFLILLRNETVTREDLFKLGDWLIITVLIMCLYNVTFGFSRFIKLFTSSGNYGMECKSFLYSNHEFAVYISVAVIFLILRLLQKKSSKVWNFILIGFFSVNLLSTYSRTALLGLFAAILIILFFASKKYFIIFASSAGAFLLIASFNSVLYNFIFNKIFKGDYDSSSNTAMDVGRDGMYLWEWNYYKSGDVIDQIFGRGYVKGAAGGGHNAYLYILNIGGIIMFAFFITVIVWSIYNSVKVWKKDKELGSLCMALQVFSLLYMVAQTPILFFSTMDSYFLTMISVLIPLYVNNHLNSNEIADLDALSSNEAPKPERSKL